MAIAEQRWVIDDLDHQLPGGPGWKKFCKRQLEHQGVWRGLGPDQKESLGSEVTDCCKRRAARMHSPDEDSQCNRSASGNPCPAMDKKGLARQRIREFENRPDVFGPRNPSDIIGVEALHAGHVITSNAVNLSKPPEG